MSEVEREASGRERRRLQILQAARSCFLEEGFHAAGMSRIAARAGISVGHIYRYFASKEAIIGAIAELDLSSAAEQMAGIEGGPAIGHEIMRSVQADVTPERRGMYFEVLAEAARNSRIAAMMHENDTQIREHLRRVLSRDQDAAWSHEDMEARINIVCLLVDGLIVRSAKVSPEELDGLTGYAGALLAGVLASPSA